MNGRKKVLVTGGAGYIGSHTCIELVQAGYDIVVLDNLSNSSLEAMKRVEKIVGKTIAFVKGDVRERKDLRTVFLQHKISAVLHFAGLKSVSESTSQPLRYYDNNVVGTFILCEVMLEFNCKVIVFSSSATVYGTPESVPIKESFLLSVTNPYGRSKMIVEDVLKDVYSADNTWSIGVLRYFNPVGAHKSGMIGESPNGIPNNLMPFISQVAAGSLDKLRIFGGDYATIDGTGVRDYIHVTDLAKGHILALENLLKKPQLVTVNLGTGQGYSVLEMVKAFEKASHQQIIFEIVERRLGDVAECYADSSLAWEMWGWRAQLGIEQMCEDVWRWQLANPRGYSS